MVLRAAWLECNVLMLLRSEFMLSRAMRRGLNADSVLRAVPECDFPTLLRYRIVQWHV